MDVAPTQDHAAIQAAVDTLKSSGDTALYDGLSLAIDTLGAAGDRSIIILSDGKDTISTLKAQPAEQKLKTSGVRAEVIAFKTSYTDNLALGYLAAAGQGSVTAVENSAKVSEAFTNAAKALNSQVSWTAPTQGVYGRVDVTLHRHRERQALHRDLDGRLRRGAHHTDGDRHRDAAPLPGNGSSANVPPAEAAAAPADTSLMGRLSAQTLLGLPLPVAIAALLLFVALAPARHRPVVTGVQVQAA